MVLAGLVLASVVVAPQTARAVTVPVVTTVTGSPTDPGLIFVSATSAVPISGVTVSVVGPFTSTAVVQTLTAFHLVSGTDTDGRWQADSRLVLDSYSTYTLVATVTDTGASASAEATGQLIYFPRAVSLTHQSGPADLDRHNPTLHVSGTIETIDPRTGTAAPIQANALQVAVTSTDGAAYGVVGADGSYAVSMTPTTPVDGRVVDFLVQVSGLTIDSGTYTEHVAASRIVIRTSTPQASDDTPLTVTGDAEVDDAGTWVPLTGVDVRLGDSAVTIGSSPADAAGHVSFTHLFRSQTTLTMSYSTNPPPFVAYATASLPLTVIVAAQPYWTQPSINEFSELVLKGSVYAPGGVAPYIPGGTLYVQQSATGTSGWRTLGYLTLKAGGSFNTVAYVAKPSGYWRLVVVPTGTGFHTAATKPIKLSRVVTRIASVTAPTTVRKGGYATVRGVVQAQTGTTWKAISRAQVYVFFRAKGTTTWRAVAGVYASRTGVFSARVRPARTGQWIAVWFTTSAKDLNAYSRIMSITVR